jgi:hypothetical protein
MVVGQQALLQPSGDVIVLLVRSAQDLVGREGTFGLGELLDTARQCPVESEPPEVVAPHGESEGTPHQGS